MEERVQQLIVTAVLEHEAISGLSSHKQPVGQGGRARYLKSLIEILTCFNLICSLFQIEFNKRAD